MNEADLQIFQNLSPCLKNSETVVETKLILDHAKTPRRKVYHAKGMASRLIFFWFVT